MVPLVLVYHRIKLLNYNFNLIFLDSNFTTFPLSKCLIKHNDYNNYYKVQVLNAVVVNVFIIKDSKYLSE